MRKDLINKNDTIFIVLMLGLLALGFINDLTAWYIEYNRDTDITFGIFVGGEVITLLLWWATYVSKQEKTEQAEEKKDEAVN